MILARLSQTAGLLLMATSGILPCVPLGNYVSTQMSLQGGCSEVRSDFGPELEMHQRSLVMCVLISVVLGFIGLALFVYGGRRLRL